MCPEEDYFQQERAHPATGTGTCTRDIGVIAQAVVTQPRAELRAGPAFPEAPSSSSACLGCSFGVCVAQEKTQSSYTASQRGSALGVG